VRDNHGVLFDHDPGHVHVFGPDLELTECGKDAVNPAAVMAVFDTDHTSSCPECAVRVLVRREDELVRLLEDEDGAKDCTGCPLPVAPGYNTWWDFDVIERELILHTTDGNEVVLFRVKKEVAREIQTQLDLAGGVTHEG